MMKIGYLLGRKSSDICQTLFVFVGKGPCYRLQVGERGHMEMATSHSANPK